MSPGTGNVLKVQHLLHICSEHYDIKDQVWQPVQCFCLSLSLTIHFTVHCNTNLLRCAKNSLLRQRDGGADCYSTWFDKSMF